MTEKCCGLKFGHLVLSRVGRTLISFKFVLMVVAAAFGISQVEVYFDQVLFVSESS